MKSFMGEQNYFEFNLLRNWKPVWVEQNRGDAVEFTRAGNKSKQNLLLYINIYFLRPV